MSVLNPTRPSTLRRITQKILSAVVRTGERFGSNHVIGVLVGSKNKRIAAAGHDNLTVYDIVSDFNSRQLKELCGQLVAKGLLVRSEGDYPTLSLSEAGWQFLRRPREVFRCSDRQESNG